MLKGSFEEECDSHHYDALRRVSVLIRTQLNKQIR